MNTTTQNTNISKETPSDESLRLAKLFILGHAHKEPWDEKEVADVIRAAVRIDAEFASILADNQRLRRDLEDAQLAVVHCKDAIAENQRLRLQHEGDAQIIRQLDGQIAELREQVGQLREALQTMVEQAACYMEDGEATPEEQAAMDKARAALSAVERGTK